MAETSPCIKICKLEGTICIGCKRTLSEIREWSSASNVRRQEILELIKNRGK